MNELTLRQQEVLGYLQVYMKENGTWPSFREIEKHFGFKSTNSVMGHLRALERKGYISRVHGQARTFRLNINLENPEMGSGDDISDVISIPVYGAIAAGYPDDVEPGGEIGRIQIDMKTSGVQRSRRSFALRVRGESMIDAGIFDGDTVIVEQAHPRNGDIVAALIDGQTTLKRFVIEDGKPPYLMAENVDYPDLHPIETLSIQGVARAVVRSL